VPSMAWAGIFFRSSAGQPANHGGNYGSFWDHRAHGAHDCFMRKDHESRRWPRRHRRPAVRPRGCWHRIRRRHRPSVQVGGGMPGTGALSAVLRRIVGVRQRRLCRWQVRNVFPGVRRWHGWHGRHDGRRRHERFGRDVSLAQRLSAAWRRVHAVFRWQLGLPERRLRQRTMHGVVPDVHRRNLHAFGLSLERRRQGLLYQHRRVRARPRLGLRRSHAAGV
jgi:hypothetical protein